MHLSRIEGEGCDYYTLTTQHQGKVQRGSLGGPPEATSRTSRSTNVPEAATRSDCGRVHTSSSSRSCRRTLSAAGWPAFQSPPPSFLILQQGGGGSVCWTLGQMGAGVQSSGMQVGSGQAAAALTIRTAAAPSCSLPCRRATAHRHRLPWQRLEVGALGIDGARCKASHFEVLQPPVVDGKGCRQWHCRLSPLLL